MGILSITETKTCEYEIQILTSALCKSPIYAQKHDTDMFGIPCEKIGEQTPTVPESYKPIKQDHIAKAIMKEVKKTGVDIKNVQMAKQETEQKKTEYAKVESALKRPSTVLDAETKKVVTRQTSKTTKKT